MLAVNASILVIAVLLLVVTPISVNPSVTRGQLAVLLAGLVVMLASNAVLLRFSLAPLHRLMALMRSADILEPGRRLNAAGTAEVAEVITAFNATLERLEEERRSSMRRVLSAQEAERRRIAQELHDQIGQNLTAVVLELKRLHGRVEPEWSETLADAQELARESLDELRRISYELRPAALDDLGPLERARGALRRGRPPGRDRRVTRRRPRAAAAPARGRARRLPHHPGGAHQRRAPLGLLARAREPSRAPRMRSCCGWSTTAADWTAAPRSGGGIRGMRERALMIGGQLVLARRRPGRGRGRPQRPARGPAGPPA